MLGTPVDEVLHLRIAPGGRAVRILRDVASHLDFGVAAYDPRLALLWANAVMRRRLMALTELDGDDAVSSLFGGSVALPRWTRRDVGSPAGPMPCLGVDFERGRTVLRSLVVPCVEHGGDLAALLLLLPGHGEGPLEELPAADRVWRSAFDRCRLAVAATPAGGDLRVLDGGEAVVLAGLRSAVSDRVRSPSSGEVAEGDRRFREGSAVSGDEAVSLATPDGGLARGRLIWVTVLDGTTPRVKLDVFHPDGPETAVAGPITDPFHRLVETCPDALLLVEGRGVVAVNPAAEELLGRSSDELVGQDLGSLALRGDGRLDALAARISVGLELPVRTVVGFRGGSGRRVEVEVHAAPATDHDTSACVVAARPLDVEVRGGLELSRIAAMLAVADLASDDRGRFRGALDLVREELGAAWVQLIRLGDADEQPVETYREPSGGSEAGDGDRPDHGRYSDWMRLMDGTAGPLVVDPDTGVPGSLERGDSPPTLVLEVPTASRSAWLLLVGCDGPVEEEDGPRARRAAQAVGWVVDRVIDRRRADALASERELLAAAVDVATPGLVIAGTDHRIRIANRAARTAFGAGGDDIANLLVHDMFAGATSDRMRDTASRLTVDGGSWQGRFEGRTPFGRDARLYLRMDPVTGPDGSPRGLIMAVWDLELQAEPAGE